jgi:hypothetical protein
MALLKPPGIESGAFESVMRGGSSRVLLYGGNVGFDFGACELIEYKAGGFHGRKRCEQRK